VVGVDVDPVLIEAAIEDHPARTGGHFCFTDARTTHP
jgi:hypothetical protein